VGAADVGEPSGALGSGRRPVFEQLEVVPVPAEVANSQVHAREAGDLLDVIADDLPVGDNV
jgi:hypothetical protein